MTLPNLLTVDLEEWFVVEILRSHYRVEEWPELPSTLELNTRRLLDLFRRRDVKATWFVLGWCADRFPELIAEIAAQGHEVACHSYFHRRVDSLDPEEFRRDTTRASEALIRATGRRPLGYRAPSWSINDSIPWAFEILAELGFEYDSSIFPIKHDLYGMPTGPRSLFRMKFPSGQFLYELPASTYRLLGKNVPVAGGGYLRHCPYWYSRTMIRRLNRKGLPAVVYMHPWELDPEPPQVSGLSATQRLRTYGSTRLLSMKLDRLLSDFYFTTMSHYIKMTRQQRIGFH
jgi:polysaccharide deacetylase family protein (PEP-CTERM system associated)